MLADKITLIRRIRDQLNKWMSQPGHEPEVLEIAHITGINTAPKKDVTL